MKDFKASEAIFICDDCGDELKVVKSEYVEELDKTKFDSVCGWWLDLVCRVCGPQGREWLAEQVTI